MHHNIWKPTVCCNWAGLSKAVARMCSLSGDNKGVLEGGLKGGFEGDLGVDLDGDFRGDFKQDLEGDLLSISGQLRSRSGLVQVWFSIDLKFNSFELDSEVGRLVVLFVSY